LLVKPRPHATFLFFFSIRLIFVPAQNEDMEEIHKEQRRVGICGAWREDSQRK
jgi:hypothetical protein